MATPRHVKLPSKVWVGAYEFPLALVASDDKALDGADGMTVTDEVGRGIWINEILDPRKMLEIVWHELTHAINWNQEIDNRSERKGSTLNCSEEVLATKHGFAWTQFFLDNPKMHRWINATVRQLQKERDRA